MAFKSRGFTIVELLIVVVVIAILAVITIVAYTGIQNRATNSALQAAASQAAKKISLSAVNAADMYPADKASFLAEANLSESATQTYDYITSDDRKSYCVSVTNQTGVSYARTNASSEAIPGKCVSNLVLNPSIEPSGNNTGAVFGQGGVATLTLNNTSPYNGTNVLRTTWTTAPTSVSTGGLWSHSISATGLNAGAKVYTASGYLRNSWAGASVSLNLVGYTTANNVTSETYGSNVTIPANTWTRVSTTWTAPANTDYFIVRLRQQGGALPSVGSTMDADGFMLTEGSTLYSYGGTGAANWAKKMDTPYSVSFGPAVGQ